VIGDNLGARVERKTRRRSRSSHQRTALRELADGGPLPPHRRPARPTTGDGLLLARPSHPAAHAAHATRARTPPHPARSASPARRTVIETVAHHAGRSTVGPDTESGGAGQGSPPRAVERLADARLAARHLAAGDPRAAAAEPRATTPRSRTERSSGVRGCAGFAPPSPPASPARAARRWRRPRSRLEGPGARRDSKRGAGGEPSADFFTLRAWVLVAPAQNAFFAASIRACRWRSSRVISRFFLLVH